MKAAIVINNYKLKTFRKNLHQAGYVWTESKAPVPETTTFTVQTDDMQALHMVINTCNAQALRNKDK